MLLVGVHEVDSQGSEYKPEAMTRRLTDEATLSAAHLFTPASFTTVGPTVFPKPSDMLGEGARPNLQPTFGQHRPDVDAVFVFAAEYGLDTYLCFVKSLRRTGFTGDIVLAVSVLDIAANGVKEFFTTTQHVVTYVIQLSCFNAENEATTSAKGGMRVCQLHHLYADAQGVPQKDPREPRTIATTRYELYWLWSLHYKPHVWIMLIDARDSYFQKNPFETVPRDTDPNKKNGILHFFGVSFLDPNSVVWPFKIALKSASTHTLPFLQCRSALVRTHTHTHMHTLFSPGKCKCHTDWSVGPES